MRKYWIVAKNEFLKHFLVYRYFIISYAGGNFIELFSQIVVWTAIFKNVSTVSGYDYRGMISYVVVGWIFRLLTTNYEYELMISKDIKLGRLSNFIVKPVDYLRYIFADSIGRLSLAFVVVIVQAIIGILIFHESLFINISLFSFIILIGFFICSYIIKFLLASLIGFISFWTTEVYGLSRGINVLMRILSGAYFPLDAIGEVFSAVALSFPFAYTLFYPTQIFLGRISALESLKALGIMLIWIVILWFCVRVLWKAGLKKYESAGM
jgi:ABC-2 type transport system permease protein